MDLKDAEYYPFTLELELGETKVRFRMEPEFDWTRIGLIPVTLTPEGQDLEGGCEKCGANVDGWEHYLIDGALRIRCPAHAEGLKVTLEPAYQPFATMKEAVDNLGENDRQKAHRRMQALHDQGLSYPKIADAMTKEGFKHVAPRTVAKHLGGECACFPKAEG